MIPLSTPLTAIRLPPAVLVKVTLSQVELLRPVTIAAPTAAIIKKADVNRSYRIIIREIKLP
jgi:hypothetical protein